ncbi:MAG: AEC family transporter [Rhodobacterales bacterium]|nr:AEC family transporter [Rhodobacterales bacterium]
MWDIFLQTLPFFAIIGLGYVSGRTGFFTPDATAYLTKFVFYFALSAMLFRFSANMSLSEVFDWSFVIAYFLGTTTVYLIATAVALARGRPVAEAAFEAQCAAIGNIGFLGIPMLALLLGERAVGYIMLMLAVDLIVFSSLIVILVTGSREGRVGLGVLRTVALGLVKNPMIVSIVAGLTVSGSGLALPTPVNSFLVTLGAAATPGALFAIGASLATKSAERLAVAGWLSFAKLVLHPAAVAIFALWVFPVEPYAAGVMIASASLPVAGNVYILAQHYGIAPLRVSAAILISTAVSIVTVSGVIAWVKTFMP